MTVNDIAPSIAISGNASVNEGTAYSLNLGAVTDPGTDTVTSIIVNWGDGSSDTYGTAGSKSHTYADGPNAYAITVDLIDEDGTFLNRANAKDVNVNNVAPSVAGNNASVTVNEGSTASNTGTWSDPGLDTVTLSASTGTVVKNTDGTWSWSFATNNGPDQTQTVTITAMDSDSATSTTTFTLLVNNVAPNLAVSGAGTVNAGATYTLSLSSNDPGTDKISQWMIQWGDGNTQIVAGNPSSVTHVYAVGGNTYTIIATATDEDGTFSANNLAVTVNAGGTTQPPASIGLGCDGPALIIFGSELADTIRVVPQGNTAVKVLINGVDRGTFLLSSFVEVIVYGKGGDDDIEIVAALTQEAFLFGDLGNDRLKGGNGPNALVGGDGDDELIGSKGNDVLIGGRGVDRLVGNQGDDLLVAGFTDHDSNLVALCAILKEWSRTDLGYQARVDDIWYGRGWNGSYRLNNVTVHDDGVVDRLTGSSGRDWFFANLGDIVTDRKNDEFNMRDF